MAVSKIKIAAFDWLRLIGVFSCFFFEGHASPFSHKKDEILSGLKSQLQAKVGDYLSSNLKRRGNKTVTIEAFLSLEGELTKAKRILQRVDQYPEWVLEGINTSPQGNGYYLIINQLLLSPATPHVVKVDYTFQLPLFKRGGTRGFKVEFWDDDPSFFVIRATNVPQEDSLIESAEGLLYLVPAQNSKKHLWVYVEGKSILKSWLLYEAMPEKLMAREIGERVQTVLLNYQKQEMK